MTPELVGILITVAAMGVTGAVAWGRLSQRVAQLESIMKAIHEAGATKTALAELGARHAENSTEFRAGIAAGSQRLNVIERVQGTVDIHLDVIRSQLSDIKALLAPAPRRKT